MGLVENPGMRCGEKNPIADIERIPSFPPLFLSLRENDEIPKGDREPH